MNPHLIRSIAAIIILNRNRGAYEEVRKVLGNRSLDVIVRHYVRQDTKAALQRYDALILELRGEASTIDTPSIPIKRYRRTP